MNAPASRFKHETVTDFAKIQSAPWPMRELLGGPRPRPLSEPPAQLARLGEYAHRLLTAREIRAMLTAQQPVARVRANRVDSVRADALRSLGMACQLDSVPERSIEMILALAAETVPFLDSEANGALWGVPDWLKCQAQDAGVRDTLAFVAAAGQNDPRRLLAAGEVLLDGPASKIVTKDAIASYYVWGAMQTALVALEEPALARATQSRYGRRLPDDVRENSVIRFVSALAVVPRGERLVGQAAQQ